MYRGGRNPTRTTNSSSHPSSRSYIITPTLPDEEAEQAIEQGRRVYVGNLPYDAKLDDIRSLLADVSRVIQDIAISIDPMTSQNPSYCFVDFTSKEAAVQAIEIYNGQTFMRRPLKVKPGLKPAPRRRNDLDDERLGSSYVSPNREENERSPAFNRWRRLDTQINTESMNNSATDEGRRLYVGGLPRFSSLTHGEHVQRIRDLFRDFEVEVVSKLVSPHESKVAAPGNHYYCFVDLRRKEDVEGAIAALNVLDKWNWNITVARASSIPGKLHERQRVFIGGLPLFEDDKTLENGIKELLQPFGEVKLASKIFEKDPNPNGKNNGYCFVEFADGAQADAAIAALDQTERRDWRVTVKRANRPKKKLDSWRGDS